MNIRTVLLSLMTLPRPEKSDWMIRASFKDMTGIHRQDFKKAGFNVTYVS